MEGREWAYQVRNQASGGLQPARRILRVGRGAVVTGLANFGGGQLRRVQFAGVYVLRWKIVLVSLRTQLSWTDTLVPLEALGVLAARAIRIRAVEKLIRHWHKHHLRSI